MTFRVVSHVLIFVCNESLYFELAHLSTRFPHVPPHSPPRLLDETNTGKSKFVLSMGFSKEEAKLSLGG